jgi:hypothetical protein
VRAGEATARGWRSPMATCGRPAGPPLTTAGYRDEARITGQPFSW